ncbi:MAG: carbohydrate kinase [Propionibacteriaceae bacterium]|jgi:fructokinase|nr:carbohydrate kinase [Propionibacteriaceae bacterium]
MFNPAVALVIGESLIDIVPSAIGPVDYPGGSPMNVAIGLSRLGHRVTLATWIGKDERGSLIESHIAKSGVQMLPGSDAAGHTSSAEVRFDKGGTAHYVFDLSWQLPPIPVDLDPLVVHIGSIAATLAPGGADALAYVRANPSRATVTYDPNIRPQIIGPADDVRECIEAYVDAADVVKVSDEDISWLYPDVDPLAATRAWLTRGCSLIVLTRGAQGVIAITAGGREYEAPAPSGPVADTVGAGDSFMAMLVHGLWENQMLGAPGGEALSQMTQGELEALITLASRGAGVTVSRPGANPPWLCEI